jgi:hypothetical protein
MRLVYAMQFRVAPLTGVGDVDLPNRLKADVVGWIGEWYRQRQGLNISLPTTTQIVTPLPLHTIDVAYSVPSVSGAGHYAVTWRYPAEPDDRLLWESRCEWATICGDTEFSFLLRLASREFLVGGNKGVGSLCFMGRGTKGSGVFVLCKARRANVTFLGGSARKPEGVPERDQQRT